MTLGLAQRPSLAGFVSVFFLPFRPCVLWQNSPGRSKRRKHGFKRWIGSVQSQCCWLDKVLGLATSVSCSGQAFWRVLMGLSRRVVCKCVHLVWTLRSEARVKVSEGVCVFPEMSNSQPLNRDLPGNEQRDSSSRQALGFKAMINCRCKMIKKAKMIKMT